MEPPQKPGGISGGDPALPDRGDDPCCEVARRRVAAVGCTQRTGHPGPGIRDDQAPGDLRVNAQDDQPVQQAQPVGADGAPAGTHLGRPRAWGRWRIAVVRGGRLEPVTDWGPGTGPPIDADQSDSLEQREMSWEPVRRDPDAAGKLALAERPTVASRGEAAQHHVDQAGLGTQLVVVQHAVGDDSAAAGISQVSNVDCRVRPRLGLVLGLIWWLWHGDSILASPVLAGSVTAEDPGFCLPTAHWQPHQRPDRLPGRACPVGSAGWDGLLFSGR